MVWGLENRGGYFIEVAGAGVHIRRADGTGLVYGAVHVSTVCVDFGRANDTWSQLMGNAVFVDGLKSSLEVRRAREVCGKQKQ